MTFTTTLSYASIAKKAFLPRSAVVTNMVGENTIIDPTTWVVRIISTIETPVVLYITGSEEPIHYDTRVSDYAHPGKQVTFFALPIDEKIWAVVKDSVMHRNTKSRLYHARLEDDNGKTDVIFLQPLNSYEIVLIKRNRQSDSVDDIFTTIRIEELLIMKISDIVLQFETPNKMTAVHSNSVVMFRGSVCHELHHWSKARSCNCCKIPWSMARARNCNCCNKEWADYSFPEIGHCGYCNKHRNIMLCDKPKNKHIHLKEWDMRCVSTYQ